MRANAGRTVLVSCGDSRLHPASANGLRSGYRSRYSRFIEPSAFSGWRDDAGPCDFFVVFAVKDFNREVREESRRPQRYNQPNPVFFLALAIPALNPFATARSYPAELIAAITVAAVPPGVAASRSNSSSAILLSRHTRIPSARACAAAVIAVWRSRPALCAAPANAANA